MNFKSKLKDFCVYWPPAAVSRAGQKGFGPPTELRCHWEDNTGAVRQLDKEEWASKAEIMLDTEVQTEGVLWYGRLSAADYSTPFNNAGASLVRVVERVPGVKSKQRLWTAFL